MNTNARTNTSRKSSTRSLALATSLWLAAALVLAPSASLQQQGGPYSLHQTVVAGGGGASSGGTTTVAGTIGQSLAGLASGGQFSLNAGFWQGVASPCSTPNVTSQPTNQTACEGASAPFSVGVSDSGVSYQWRKNSVDISGATSSTLMLNNITMADAASYDVVVSQSCGSSITSSPATLAVSPYSLAPTSASYPAAGGTGSFNISVAGSCPWAAVSNDSWISITTPLGGLGAGNNLVSYSVAAGSASRTGTVTVAGKTFTVTQAAPTAITLISFAANNVDNGVSLEWQTGFEVDNLGFNLYRNESGKHTLLNQRLIAGSALTVGEGVAVRSGFSYQWWDARTSGDSSSYWLEAIDLHGQSTWHGPFYAQPAGSITASSPSLKASRTLSNLGKVDSPSTQIEPLVNATAPTSSKKFAEAAVVLGSTTGVKISVKRAGLYRITQPELKGALDPGVDPRMLRLFVDGHEQAIAVSGEADGSFDSSDSIEFYGLGIDSPFTDSHNYFLAAGKQPGQRIASVPSPAKPNALGSFACTIERRDRTTFFAALRNGERENFFGPVLTAQQLTQSLTVHHLDISSPGTTLEVALQGVTYSPHIISVQLNGSPLGYLNFHNQEAATITIPIHPSLVVEGQNTLTLQTTGNPSDVSLVDYLRLTYAHRYAADDDALRFTAQGGQAITVAGFTGEAIRVFDVTNADAVQELEGLVDKAENGFSVSLQTQGNGERLLLALTDSTIKHPSRITPYRPSSLRTVTQKARFAIIAHHDLLNAAQALKSLRTAQGLSVAVVDVEDIFNEFSFGQKTPYALRDFLDYAKKNWLGPLQYALFFGDASNDMKNYLGLGEFDLVSTRFIDTTFIEAASDEWLADFDHDGLADLAVGRLPARNEAEAELMIKKLTRYEQIRPSDEVLGVADVNDGYNFEDAIDRLLALVPGDLRSARIKRGQLGDSASKALLVDALNRGHKLVSYSGHGSINVWRGNLLTDADAGQLRNPDALSVFLMMNCLNGYFIDSQVESLSEALLKAEGGAVATWASTALTYPDGQNAMIQELYRQLFANRGIRIGDAVARAKAAAFVPEVRQTWVLFGDPTIRIK